MPLVSETVAIPVVKGINVTTTARLLDSVDLLEAENARFPTGSGARKRRGHTGERMRGAKPLPPSWAPPDFQPPRLAEPYATDDRGLPSQWYFGYGYSTDGVRMSAATALETSPYPESGLAFGATNRDSESVVWDGFRLLSRTKQEPTGGRMAEFAAVMPALRAEPIAKTNIGQSQPDVADNGIVRLAAWIYNSKAYYSVVDSVLGTTIVSPKQLEVNIARQVRCIPVGKWLHMAVTEDDDDTIQLFSVYQDEAATVNKQSMGASSGYFDFCKINETSWYLALSQTTQVTLRQMDATGAATAVYVLDTGTTSAASTVGICAHPAGLTGLVWRDGTSVKARLYNSSGVAQGTVKTLGVTGAVVRPVAIAPKWLVDATGEHCFNAYWDSWSGSVSTLNIARFTKTGDVVYSASAFYKTLASTAFRVGDRTFVWVGNRSTYQSTWMLLDESLRPVGHLDYIGADVRAPTDFPSISTVNWWGSASDKDRTVYHVGLGFRVRVPVTPKIIGSNAPAVYTEPSIRFARMDFLPRLRSAQAGRSTYFAGAQLWTYDGADLSEAGFHLAPEGVTVGAGNSGSMTTGGKYTYRIDLCYRNAQNEEVRSASFFTPQLILVGGQNSATVTIPTVMTRRSDAYFLIFRNESEGTLWYLVNSRDPASAQFVRNDQSIASVTFIDNASDTAILQKEQHPGETVAYLDQFAAPACEVVAAGRDRLWVAGGEISPGQVYPSRLFDPGECPSFHGGIAIQVDRSAEPITAIGFVGEYTVFFRKTQTYILDGEGPDNALDDNDQPWQKPRDSKADVGAVGQDAVKKISAGLLFQAPAGIRLLTPGGAILPVGQPVDALAEALNITSTVVVAEDQEVRFYSWDGPTLVYNYQYNVWSTWNIKAAGAVQDTTGLAVVATPTGALWVETDGLWTDNSGPFRMRIRFAWLHAGSVMDFQRVRRIGALGSAAGAHSIHVDVYYNEQDFAAEFFDWTVPSDNQNLDTFGSTIFGDGNFGDNTSLEGIQFRDSTWAWRRRLNRQKCSVISIAVDDNYTNGEGFALTALALEIAKKSGLDRTTWRGGTYSNAGGSGSIESGSGS